jgi:DNA repair protein RecO (recombination protein O)
VATPTKSCRVLVVRKTKLRETDLIITFLHEDGSLGQAVARGARKPGNTFASRLEYFCLADVLIAKGRGLPIVTEARCVNAHARLREDVLFNAASSPILDALAKCGQPDLPVPRLFDMACAALDELCACQEDDAPAICAAFLVKLFAMLGFRPRVSTCVSCGAQVPLEHGAWRDFSFVEGGAVCIDCRSHVQTQRIEATTLLWVQTLLGQPFARVRDSHVPLQASFAVLHFAHQWFREHMGLNLKSLNFLLTSGLF